MKMAIQLTVFWTVVMHLLTTVIQSSNHQNDVPRQDTIALSLLPQLKKTKQPVIAVIDNPQSWILTTSNTPADYDTTRLISNTELKEKLFYRSWLTDRMTKAEGSKDWTDKCPTVGLQSHGLARCRPGLCYRQNLKCAVDKDEELHYFPMGV